MNKNQIIGAIAGLVVVGGGAFYGGIAYAKGQAPANQQLGKFANGQFTRGMGGRMMNGGFTAGKIISVSNGSMTIQSAQSSSTEIVLLSNSTQIEKTVSGSQSDLAAGTNVVVTGSQNSDGSLTAQAVQIRPAGTQFFGGRPQSQ